MGAKATRFIPKYISNFNIENRALKQVERIREGHASTSLGGDPLRVSPRHPSTVAALKEREKENVKGVDIYPAELNENLKKLGGITSTSTDHHKTNESVVTSKRETVVDKRPKKENELAFAAQRREFDVDLDNYGYAKPDRIKTGNLTLRQFDELANEFKRDKQEKTPAESLTALAAQHNLDREHLTHMLDYFKPFTRVVADTKKIEASSGGGDSAARGTVKREQLGGENDNETIANAMKIENIFPHLSESAVKELSSKK